MLGHHAIETTFRLLGKRIVRGSLIGEFGMSADRRDGPRIKQRCARRYSLERAIRVPQPVAQLERAKSALLAPDLVLVIEVGNVGKFFAQTQCRVLSIDGNRGLERAEVPREFEV
jgi:hypothetical protein